MKPVRVLFPATVALVAATLGVAPAAMGTSSPGVGQATVVSAVPATGTPQVVDGAVVSFAEVGSTIVAGGSFTQVQNYNQTTTYGRNRLFAFNENSGAISTSFAPSFNDQVYAVLPGPSAGTVYAAGFFTKLNDASVSKVVLLNVSNGSLVPSFNAGTITGRVDALRMVNGQLIIGGTFNKVNGTGRGRLASLNPTTGALTTYLTATLTGHHNFGHAPPPIFPPGFAVQKMPTAALAIDLNPQHTKMVVVGNFDAAGGLARDQIAMFNLNATTATVEPNWNTNRFNSPCFSFKFDEWIRDVSFSPDGSYFAIATAGGHDFDKPINAVLCDTLSKWNTGDTGQDVQPAWVSYSGSDSFLAVTTTGAAIYGGGHPRWMNNVLGNDGAGPGAVARASVTALDPVSGMPLAWNPGREPRGHGIEALLATSTGLWTGSDTDYVGPNKLYTRKKIAYFPLAGGSTPASTATTLLPATVHLAGPNGGSASSITNRIFTGTAAGSPTSVASPVDWTAVRGAVTIGNTLFYGKNDAMLYKRSFDGATFGPEQTVNPYNDPLWDTVTFGCIICNGGNTYAGIRPDFYADLPNVSAMAYDSATERLYYTRSGDSALYYRQFSPDSGIIFPVATAVTGVDMTATTGLLLSGTDLYVASGGDGNLSQVTLTSAGFSGSPSIVSGPGLDGVDWRASALFTGP